MAVAVRQVVSDGIHFRTQAEEIRKGWFRWKVFVDEPPEVLNTIYKVLYILHPTFKDRFHEVTDRSSQFALESEGWGEFNIRAEVYRQGLDVEQTAQVPLRFTNP